MKEVYSGSNEPARILPIEPTEQGLVMKLGEDVRGIDVIETLRHVHQDEDRVLRQARWLIRYTAGIHMMDNRALYIDDNYRMYAFDDRHTDPHSQTEDRLLLFPNNSTPESVSEELRQQAVGEQDLQNIELFLFSYLIDNIVAPNIQLKIVSNRFN